MLQIPRTCKKAKLERDLKASLKYKQDLTFSVKTITLLKKKMVLIAVADLLLLAETFIPSNLEIK